MARGWLHMRSNERPKYGALWTGKLESEGAGSLGRSARATYEREGSVQTSVCGVSLGGSGGEKECRLAAV